MKAVFHIDLDDDKILRIGLTNMENLRKAKPKAHVHLVVNGPAVQCFRQDRGTEIAPRVDALINAGCMICICENAMRTFGVTPADLMPGCVTVPAGVVALVEHQQQGYAYIKP